LKLGATLLWIYAGLLGPPDPTHAPKMADDRSLDEAVIIDPGLTCLDRATLLADLASWRDSPRVDLRVGIHVYGSTDDADTVTFEVRVRDEVVVERSFSPAPSKCADLHAVVALAIAIALDDTLAGELGIVEPHDPLAPVEQVTAGDGDLPKLAPRPSPSRRGPALAVTVAAGVFAGLTPRLSGGGLVSFDIRPREHFDLRIGGLATHLPGFALDTGEVAVTVAAGRLDLCWGTKPMAVRLRVCGGAAAGATRSRATGFTHNFRRTTPWFAGLADIDVAVHLVGPLALELRVEGVFPLQRTRLDVRSESGQLLGSELFPVAGVLVAVGPRFEF
jgi:hypothetical protein